MARWSDPNEGMSNDRFKVWDENLDLYAHLEMAGNWDTLDAILGMPADGATWPPLAERGLGKGIYKLVSLLQKERPKLGELAWAWTPSGTVFDLDGWQAKGYEIANGQTIAAGNHHFPGITAQSIRVPQILNRTVVGADRSKPLGAVGSATDVASGAPGIVQFDGVANQGEGGSNVKSLKVKVPAHQHPLPDHSHIMPGHTHTFSHEHWATEFTGGTRVAGVVYELNDSAIYQKFSIPPDVMYHESFGTSSLDGYGILPYGDGPKRTSQGYNRIAGLHHYHDTAYWNGGGPNGRMVTSGPKAPIGGAGGFDKDTQPAPDNVTTSVHPDTVTTGVIQGTAGLTSGSAGAVDIAVIETVSGLPGIDNRMLHVGMVPLIKVRHVTSV